ncbi:unnamed protein product [Citrullus colocynthis]|uniref:Uncharacterized protein n=1 Tax=Citrullus colocynthis TaxID=252529 RepID=A0ABP0YB07_9ROSI
MGKELKKRGKNPLRKPCFFALRHERRCPQAADSHNHHSTLPVGEAKHRFRIHFLAFSTCFGRAIVVDSGRGSSESLLPSPSPSPPCRAVGVLKSKPPQGFFVLTFRLGSWERGLD